MARLLSAIALATLTALPLAAGAAGFATDAEGWSTTNGGVQTWMPTGGNASLAAVLANVTGLTIKGEFHAGVTEVVGIDNIEVSAVPEPAQAALLLGGLALLAGLRRKR